MIFGIGFDSVKILRIEKIYKKFSDKFLLKIFSENEILFAQKLNYERKIKFFAKRFAAKEAFSKALGIGIGRGINFKDIEISNDELGKPFIILQKSKINFLRKKIACDNFNIHLSLSDEEDSAYAYVIIEKIL